jgi:hypothetical protein
MTVLGIDQTRGETRGHAKLNDEEEEQTWEDVEEGRVREEKTHHDNHNSFNTPPDPSGIIMIRKPMKPSSDRGIFFGLILSFPIISSSLPPSR